MAVGVAIIVGFIFGFVTCFVFFAFRISYLLSDHSQKK